jgi:hypothetical protein
MPDANKLVMLRKLLQIFVDRGISEIYPANNATYKWVFISEFKKPFCFLY